MNDQVVARLVTIVVVGAVLTGVLSLLLLWLYHRAVLRGMDKYAAGGDMQSSVDEVSTDVKGSKHPLTVSLINERTISTTKSNRDPAMSAARLSMRRIMLSYFLAGMAYALTVTAIYLVIYGFTLGRFLWLMMDYAWPIAIALTMIRAIDRRERFTIVTVYFVLLLGIGIIILLRSPKVSALDHCRGVAANEWPCHLVATHFSCTPDTRCWSPGTTRDDSGYDGCPDDPHHRRQQ